MDVSDEDDDFFVDSSKKSKKKKASIVKEEVRGGGEDFPMELVEKRRSGRAKVNVQRYADEDQADHADEVNFFLHFNLYPQQESSTFKTRISSGNPRAGHDG